MNRIPSNARFLGVLPDGRSLYAVPPGIAVKKERKPPWHCTIVTLLIKLHDISPDDYESYRSGQRELREIWLDERLHTAPDLRSLYDDPRYRNRFKPLDRYFTAADAYIVWHSAKPQLEHEGR